MTASEISARLQEVWCDQSYFPPVPNRVALRTLRLNHSDPDPEPLLRAMKVDPLLALHAWRCATATYTVGETPLSLDGIVRCLGPFGAAEVVSGLSSRLRSLEVPVYNKAMKATITHTVRLARHSRAIAEQTTLDPDQAYLAGLLSDVGVLACLGVMADDPEPPDLRHAWNDIMDLHADTTRFVLQCLNLPETFAWALADHHGYEGEGASTELGACVILAEQLCAETGATALPFPQRRSLYLPPTAQVDLARERLGVDATAWTGLLRSQG